MRTDLGTRRSASLLLDAIVAGSITGETAAVRSRRGALPTAGRTVCNAPGRRSTTSAGTGSATGAGGATSATGAVGGATATGATAAGTAAGAGSGVLGCPDAGAGLDTGAGWAAGTGAEGPAIGAGGAAGTGAETRPG